MFVGISLPNKWCIKLGLVSYTLPETNIAPANRASQKETIVFQPSIFQVPTVSFREGIDPFVCLNGMLGVFGGATSTMIW